MERRRKKMRMYDFSTETREEAVYRAGGREANILFGYRTVLVSFGFASDVK